MLVAIRMVGSGKQVYHSQRGELSLGRYEGWAGRNRRTLRKGKELLGRDTKGGARESSVPFVRRGSFLVAIRRVGRGNQVYHS